MRPITGGQGLVDSTQYQPYPPSPPLAEVRSKLKVPPPGDARSPDDGPVRLSRCGFLAPARVFTASGGDYTPRVTTYTFGPLDVHVAK